MSKKLPKNLKHLFLVAFLFASTAITMAQTNAWINEFHYDNVGGDTNESVEVVIENPGMLSDYAVVRYNGNDGATYGSTTLDTFTEGVTVGAYTIYSFVYPSGGLQNGPDALALTYQGSLIAGQFLSYEGAFMATNGPANGLTSTDIGVAESGTTATTESLQLTGTGGTYSAFTWTAPSTANLGMANTGQTIMAGANTGPSITNIATDPMTVTPANTVDVSATITDVEDNVASAQLAWGLTNGGPYTNTIVMSLVSGTTYSTDTSIPAQADGTTVYYIITATDDDAMPETTTTAQNSYDVNATPAVGFQLDDVDTIYTIDFDTTVAEVNEGTFDGSGFVPTPATGQLDSDSWLVQGLSDGDSAFGDSNTAGDFTGSATFGSSIVGINAIEVMTGNVGLGFQPGGSDLTPGLIAFRFQNNTGETITRLSISYEVYVYNDEERSNSITLRHGTEANLAGGVANLGDGGLVLLNSPEVSDATPTAKRSILSNSIFTNATNTGLLNIAPGETYIIAWETDDVSGSGSRDEFALDNIQILANSALSQFTFSGGDLENMILGSNYNLTGATNIYNQFYNVQGVFQTNAFLTLKSSAEKTAYTGPFIAGSTVIGNVTAERFIPAKRAFRILSSPLTTSNSINANLQEGAMTATANPVPGFGTHITGSTAGADGFDATPSGNPSMFTLDNSTQAFEAVPNTDTKTLTAGEPLLTLIRGSRSIDVTDNEAIPDNTTLRATGTLELDAVTQSFTTTADTQDASGGDGTFFLFGNPFARAVDMSAIFSGTAANGAQQNLNPNFYYIFDPQINGDNGRGGYVTIDLSDGSNNTGGVSDANGYLQSWQGAFAAIVDNTPGTDTSITFGENAEGIAGASQTNTFDPETVEGTILGKLLRVEDGVTALSDSFVIKFGSTLNSGIDLQDAPKLSNLDENFAVRTNDQNLSIESRSNPSDDTLLNLYWDNLRGSTYNISLTLENIDLDAYLVDYFTASSHLLSSGENNIEVIVTDNETSSSTDRFDIVFGLDPLSTPENAVTEVTISPNPFSDEGLTISSPEFINNDVTVKLTNILGQQVYSKKHAASTGILEIREVATLPSGIYIITLETNTSSTVRKVIKN